jgi:hypothetical protein
MRITSRREFVQVTGLAVAGLAAATGWTDGGDSPGQDGAGAETAAAGGDPATAFPWIGL